jgi:hypothetical protein
VALVVTIAGTLLTTVPSAGGIGAIGTVVGGIVGVAIGNTGRATGTVSVACETGGAIIFTPGLLPECDLPFFVRTVFGYACFLSPFPFLKPLFPEYVTTFCGLVVVLCCTTTVGVRIQDGCFVTFVAVGVMPIVPLSSTGVFPAITIPRELLIVGISSLLVRCSCAPANGDQAELLSVNRNKDALPLIRRIIKTAFTILCRFSP